MTTSLLSFFASRRLVTVCALSISALLAACSSGSVVDPLQPTRVISFGDALSDVGQNAGQRFTVNDSTTNIWVQELAARYGLGLTASGSGGLGFAADGAGVSGISAQISTFLGANSIGAKDLIVIDAGYAELVALAGANTGAALNTAADAAGKALAAQVKRLPAAGGKHVVIANAPDLGKTPYAATANRAAELTAATRAFNDGLKIALADVTNSVLLIDNEAEINNIRSNANSILGAGANISAAVCTTPTAQTCTPTTLLGGPATSYNLYLYADNRHFTPNTARRIGSVAYDKVKQRW
jgi:outer membrane lipase/esterase